jgi:hypothetical protein
MIWWWEGHAARMAGSQYVLDNTANTEQSINLAEHFRWT